jgi:hypothetical protein
VIEASAGGASLAIERAEDFIAELAQRVPRGEHALDPASLGRASSARRRRSVGSRRRSPRESLVSRC